MEPEGHEILRFLLHCFWGFGSVGCDAVSFGHVVAGVSNECGTLKR